MLEYAALHCMHAELLVVRVEISTGDDMTLRIHMHMQTPSARTPAQAL